ncbi:ornithine cyclodeaminase family protein [Pseudoteredinibacter isoporae]|uniref:ornithine cyclodeaminase family protein n=1 Tax=Pseudoteredinibacter isoporae TaxID=570281 RepID=UPI00310A5041
MLVINRQDIHQLIDVASCIEIMRQAMVQVSQGKTRLPLRWGLQMPNQDLMGMMPGYLAEPECFGLKVVNMMQANRGGINSSHLGCMMLFEAEHGKPLALIDAGEITAMRTAAASAMATDFLARKNASRLAVIGSGEQAISHIHAIDEVRDLDSIHVWFRNPEKADDFIAQFPADRWPPIFAHHRVDECLQGADIVCTVSAAQHPIVFEPMLEAGMHLNVVGSSIKEHQELDCQALLHCRYFVDYLESANHQAGELIHAREQRLIGEDYVQGEIGQLINGEIEGRHKESDITVYRSLGVAAQDLALAHYLYQQAVEKSLGTSVDFL